MISATIGAQGRDIAFLGGTPSHYQRHLLQGVSEVLSLNVFSSSYVCIPRVNKDSVSYYHFIFFKILRKFISLRILTIKWFANSLIEPKLYFLNLQTFQISSRIIYQTWCHQKILQRHGMYLECRQRHACFLCSFFQISSRLTLSISVLAFANVFQAKAPANAFGQEPKIVALVGIRDATFSSFQ